MCAKLYTLTACNQPLNTAMIRGVSGKVIKRVWAKVITPGRLSEDEYLYGIKIVTS